MSLANLLAERVFQLLDAPAEDHLRMLTATNLVAGLGELGQARGLLDRLPFEAERSAPDAAVVAGVRLHARTQDDFYPHGRVHVGAITLAATLALSEVADDRLLDCLTAGYDVMAIASEAASTYAQGRGLRPSGLFGPLGAAASAACALGLDEAGMANAIGLAAAVAGGTNQAWLSGTDEWMFVVAYAARTGVEAALLTQAGVTASEHALEGKAGWGAAYFGDRQLAGMYEALEDERSRVGVVAAKPYPVSGIAQLVAHVACVTSERLSTLPTSVTVRLAEPETRYPGTVNSGPFRGRADALMSVPFVVACGLTHGAIRLEHLEVPSSAGVDELISRIEVVADHSLEEAEAVLVVQRPDGETIETHIGDDIMFPSWRDLRSDPAGLAHRSEAPIGITEDVCLELASPKPNAERLRRWLLEDT